MLKGELLIATLSIGDDEGTLCLELVGEHEHAISLIKTLKGYTFLDYDLDEYEGSGLTTLTFKKEVKNERIQENQ
ncbi:hypothetical protein PVA45_08350 (plasmid) [Entomospira entomophila]|uniref:Uncharacterized protein n=1 Tax=Entomospira entomophila TaxID=2719988 RepID=A0A968GDM3_9SPIO|nr:hypothetical protein [Entomospira entomophilus]NIZ41531.1 hypothetical protein [Entomospira entomophilus]WDI36441.1 hypothetical protein PVA45_08350 [Entomospira entomophilus]